MTKFDLLFVLFLSACSSFSVADTSKVEIDLQSGFEGQYVSIYVNKIEVIRNQKATSDESTGLASSLTVRVLKNANLELLVMIDNRRYSKKYFVTEDLYVGVEKSSKTVRINSSNEPYYYD